MRGLSRNTQCSNGGEIGSIGLDIKVTAVLGGVKEIPGLFSGVYLVVYDVGSL